MKKNVNKAFLYLRVGFIVVGVFYAIIFAFFQQFKAQKPTTAGKRVNIINVYREQINKQLFAKGKTDQEEIAKRVQRGTMCIFSGEACSKNTKDADKNFNGSILGMMTNATSYSLTNKPASGAEWASNSLQKIGIVPKTYAQGIGYGGLLPIAGLWQVFRNVAYMILVLFIVAIGFMIMFRTKINPQTVISVENALPRIVVALLVITFSFPIAGFMIDIMYVVMGLGVSIIVNQIPPDVAQSMGLTNNLYNEGAWGLFDAIFLNGAIWKAGPAVLQMIPTVMQWVTRVVVVLAASISAYNLIPPLKSFVNGEITKSLPFVGSALSIGVSTLVIGILLTLMFWFVPFLLSFIVWMTALFIFFRILFMLLSTYVQILLLIVFSPLMLLFEAIPGRNAFSDWLKNLFVLLMTFPVVAIMFTVSAYITSLVTAADLGKPVILQNVGELGINSGNIWRPPFIYAQDSSGFIMIVGIAILFIIPDMVKFLKEAMGVKGLPFTIGPGTLLAGGSVAVGGLFGLFGQVSAFQTSMFGHNAAGGKGLAGAFNNIWGSFLPKKPDQVQGGGGDAH